MSDEQAGTSETSEKEVTEEVSEEVVEEKPKRRGGRFYGMRKETKRKLIEVARLIASGVPVKQALRQVGLSGDSYTKYRSYIKQLVKKFREGIEEAEVAKELKKVPPSPSEVEEAEQIIRQYLGGETSPLPPELQHGLEQVKSAIAFFDEVDRLKHQFARKLGLAARPAAPMVPPGLKEEREEEKPSKPFDFESVLKTVEEMEKAAKEFLERRGYKVLPPGSPGSLEEAKKLLESYGYKVQRDCVPIEKVQEMLKIAREEGYKEGYEAAKKEFSEQQSEWKVQQLKTAEALLGKVIDRVFAPFEYLIAKYLGVEYSYSPWGGVGVGGVGSSGAGASYPAGGSSGLVSEIEELAREAKKEKGGEESGEESGGGGEGGG